jgi:hypothetical protein
MVVGHGIHAAELSQVVLVRSEVSVPGHHIEGGVVSAAFVWIYAGECWTR